jgi:hypothetical protein
MIFLLQTHEWVVLSLTVMAFGVVGALALLNMRPRYPDGDHYEGTFRRHDVEVIFAVKLKRADAKELVKRCAVATWATAFAVPPKAKGPLDHVCVYFVDDDDFESFPYRGLDKAAAFLTKTKGWRPIPMAVIRSRYLEEMRDKGEPLIHELLHAALGAYSEPDKDRDHSHMLAWRANAGVESWQAVAQYYFKQRA